MTDLPTAAEVAAELGETLSTMCPRRGRKVSAALYGAYLDFGIGLAGLLALGDEGQHQGPTAQLLRALRQGHIDSPDDEWASWGAAHDVLLDVRAGLADAGLLPLTPAHEVRHAS